MTYILLDAVFVCYNKTSLSITYLWVIIDKSIILQL